ncbi:cellulase family glycosylhydrolase [Spirosoma soli]|uniref:mannan endo-1,4-beta-mannosidase n=1 Tax=Spirosoma soli TaxID=1770529 RepID=A0ABW5MBC8_9BACT
MVIHKPYSRLLIGSSGLVAVALLVAAIGQFWVYVNSGARREEALNLTTVMLETHTPRVVWLPDDPETGRPMEDFTREQLVGDYVRAWYQWQLSYLAGKPVGMKEYFTTDALPKATSAVTEITQQGHRLHQTDVEHNLQLHFYSADGQIVSFTDHHLLIKQRLFRTDTQEKIYTDQSVADYQVVMLLDDGFWRIKHIVRQPAASMRIPKPTPTDQASFVQMAKNGFVVNGKPFFPAGVNYYPQRSPWSLFWKQFDANVINADFQRIRELKLNTVRVFVNFHDFGKGQVPPERLNQLESVLDLANQHGLTVLVTLFDFVGDYRLLNLTATDRQLEQILTRFNKHPALLAWDVKNEPDLDFKHHDPDDVREWLDWIVTRARQFDPNHLITIGWAYPENAHLMAKQVDFVSFHSYRSLEELATGITDLQQKVPQKTLLLEEFGQPTYRGVWAPFGKSEDDQKQYVGQVRDILKQHKNIPYLVWTLYDFTDVPADVVGSKPWQREPQKHFGILRADGQPKPVTDVLKP